MTNKFAYCGFFPSLSLQESGFQHKIELEFWPLSIGKVMIYWKRRLVSYWKNSNSNYWHWKDLTEKLQFFSFLLIIILLHFRKVPILLTQLDCHIHFSVSLPDFFLYLIRLCHCCTSEERCNKKNFFVDWNCFYFFSQDLDQQLNDFGEPLALEVTKFVLCVCILTFRTCNNVPKCLTERIISGKFQPDNWLYFFHQGFN